jgi:predicted outer membrane repeat protein
LCGDAAGGGWTCALKPACEDGSCTTANYRVMGRQKITLLRGGATCNYVFRHTKFAGLEQNSRGENGGAMLLQGAGKAEGAPKVKVLISFALFWKNAAQSGGAIAADTSTRLSISFTSFSYNQAWGGNGGAIYFEKESAVIIVYTAFVGNYAYGLGGALASENGGMLQLSDSSFVSNNGDGSDHIYIISARRVKIKDTTFDPFASRALHREGYITGGLSVQIGGVPYDCAEHPCSLGQSCKLSDYSISCKTCPQFTAGLDGIECSVCPIGHGPSEDHTSCLPCLPKYYSDAGLCKLCSNGYMADENKTGCEDIDECADNNGGCDDLMGSGTKSLPCTNSMGGFTCNDCPPAYTRKAGTKLCQKKVLDAEHGAIAPYAMATLYINLDKREFDVLANASSSAYANLSTTIANTTGVPQHGFRIRLLHWPESRRRALAASPLGTNTHLEIIFGSMDLDIQRAAFTSLTAALRLNSSELAKVLPTVHLLLDAEVVAFDIACDSGMIPSGDSSYCIECSETQTSEFDEDSRSWQCTSCPTGRHGNICQFCLPSFYSLKRLGPLEPCHKCSDLQSPMPVREVNVNNLQLSLKPSTCDTAFCPHAVCPGGIPGQTAGICPQIGLWVHSMHHVDVPHLLACETNQACRLPSDMGVPNCTVLLAQFSTQPGAVCGKGYSGFMCSQCAQGYSKVAKECVPCPGFDFPMLALGVAVNFATAFFLLHKSTKATIASTEIEKIWHKVDIDHKNELDQQGVTHVLEMMGVYASPDKVSQMMIKEFGALEEGPKAMVVTRDYFVLARSTESPTAALGIAIFFIQSYTLLAKESSYFDVGDNMNMDAEATAGQCLSPLTYPERFVLKVILSPISIFLFILLSAPLWNLLRKCKCLHKAWEFLKAPPAITSEHRRRATINVYLFCFAPLSRSAIEALVCVETCTDANIDDCTHVVAADMGVRCYEGEHAVAMVLGWVVLALMLVIIPARLLRLVRDSRRRRDFSLNLRADEIDKTFAELDSDNSGSLDLEETKVLLKMMQEPVDTESVGEMMRSMNLDNDGDIARFTVSKPQFEIWYRSQLQNLVGTPFDILYGTTTSAGYWWFAQVLWLKTAINVLFTLGSNELLADWHIWMHCVLAGSVIAMVNQQPYISGVDAQVELFALLCLAAVTHVSSVFQAGEDWSSEFLVLAVVLFVLPLLALAYGIIWLKKYSKKKRAQLAKAQDQELRRSGDNVAVATLDDGSKGKGGCCGRCCHRSAVKRGAWTDTTPPTDVKYELHKVRTQAASSLTTEVDQSKALPPLRTEVASGSAVASISHAAAPIATATKSVLDRAAMMEF